MKLIKTAALALLATGGCAGPFTDVTKTDMGYDAPADPNKVEVLYLKPEGSFKEVGAIVTEGWGLHDVAKMQNALRDKSGPVGANAVVLTYPYFTFDAFGNRYLGYQGVAIKK